MTEAYSIRESLQGALSDFVRTSGFACVATEEIVRELVGMLAVYREEDSQLFPEVYVLLNEDALHVIAPSAERIVLGVVAHAKEAAETCLKRCASLAGGGWAVFLVKTGDSKFKFGLFRSLRHAFASGAEEAMGDLGEQCPILLIRNRGHLVVELRNSKNQTFTVTLRTVTASPTSLSEHVSKFTSVLDVSEAFRPYCNRMLTRLLQSCHGTLVAVLDALPPTRDNALLDGVWLDPPLKLQDRYTHALSKKDADSLSDLQAAESLLDGMVNSDGVIILGRDASVQAFRVFLKPEPEERDRLPDKGGGRMRTFELMKLRLRKTFRAVLIRSQDGNVDCEKDER